MVISKFGKEGWQARLVTKDKYQDFRPMLKSKDDEHAELIVKVGEQGCREQGFPVRQNMDK